MSLCRQFQKWLGRGVWAALLAPMALHAGGSGLNTVVVVNQASSNSLAAGNYFCERRQVPPQNVLRLNWNGGNIQWSLAQCQSVLTAPLQSMLTERGLAGQIEVVALSMDIPYRVTDAGGVNSTTAALFYGFKADTESPVPAYPSCSLPPDSLNRYANSELPFRLSPPGTNGLGFLATMLTGYTLNDALRLVDQGTRSDGSFPTQMVLLQRTTDAARSVRYFSFDNAIFDARLQGRFPMARTNSNETAGLTNLLGLQTGLANFTMLSDAFVPGALADSLTSYGGSLFDSGGQTPLLGFLSAGATGSYGTVVEPCNYTEKFPDPLAYFYVGRGFSLAEAYYQSLANPYQGLIVAEPLAAPFARPGAGAWPGLASNAVLSGTASLDLAFTAANAAAPMQQVDLFVDGVKWQTLTNVAPATGNILSITVNGYQSNCAVPANATLASVARVLADTLNAASNNTRVAALAYGDRLELESTDPTPSGAQTLITVSNVPGSAAGLSTFATVSRTNFLDSVARGWRWFSVGGAAVSNDWLQLTATKTNGENVVLSVTNGSPVSTTVELTRQLLALLNATPALQGADGVSSEDTYADGSTNLQFLLFARSPGWPAAQIQIALQASANLFPGSPASAQLDERLTDLRPRNHLCVTAGTTNLAFAFALDTTTLADGWHELVAVAYEGSHVRTQTRAVQRVRVSNTPLTATFATSAPLGVAAVGDALQFVVTASTNAIARIELFGTGGSLGVVSNQTAANFSVAGTNLGPGLHPFYALVTDSLGKQYRTETQMIRLSTTPPPFPFVVTGKVELQEFAGSERAVIFVASGSGACQTNLLTLTFTNAGSARRASYLLPVSTNATSLSVKTAWHLRQRLPLNFTHGQATADFTGPTRLRGGDLDGSNVVNLDDYSALAAAWYTSATAADLDGNGLVDILDYFILASNWLLEGDPE